MEKACLTEMQKKYGTRMVVIYCLTTAYRYLYDEEVKKTDLNIKKANTYFGYVKKHSSSISGQAFIKLYRDVQEELKKYDKS